ncbi:hypothetical protein PABG_12325 [Paracoccidioides brasiliensis Pb03]|nr:hypothetical protein PABG_12325 [Paracoccidioides brasiliensis Pb03]
MSAHTKQIVVELGSILNQLAHFIKAYAGEGIDTATRAKPNGDSEKLSLLVSPFWPEAPHREGHIQPTSASTSTSDVFPLSSPATTNFPRAGTLLCPHLVAFTIYGYKHSTTHKSASRLWIEPRSLAHRPRIVL